jgi:hypothetical protein
MSDNGKGTTTSYDEWIKIPLELQKGSEDLRHLFIDKGLYALIPSGLINDKPFFTKTRRFHTEQDLIEFSKDCTLIYQAWKLPITSAAYWLRYV